MLALGCALAARALTVVDGGIQPIDPGVVRALGLQVAFATLVTVLSVALGTLLRSVAGGIGVVLALVLVLPPLLGADGRLRPGCSRRRCRRCAWVRTRSWPARTRGPRAWPFSARGRPDGRSPRRCSSGATSERRPAGR